MSDTSRPDYQSPAYAKMATRWQRVRDLSGGVELLRNNTYLPRHRFEPADAHEQRKQLATLDPIFDTTVNAAIGLLFSDPPELSTDVPEQIRGNEEDKETEGWWENIDLAGTHGADFVRDVVENALRYGHCGVLVENQPPLGPEADAAQEQASGRRPYWVMYEPWNIFNPISSIEGGRQVLQQVTLQECVQERDGDYGTKEVKQYRTFYRLDGRVYWQLERKSDADKDQFIIVDDGETGLKEIPFDVIYGKKAGFFESEPPLMSLVELNLAHFHKSSVYQQNVDANQFNILVTKGAGEDPPQIGPHSWIGVPIDGSAEFIGANAEGPGIAREAMMDLKAAMLEQGAALPEDAGNAKTAQQVRTENAKLSAKTLKLKQSAQDAIERLLGFTAEYKNLGSGGSITIGGALDEVSSDAQEDQVYLSAVDAGHLSRLTWLRMQALKIKKFVPDFDAEKEDAELKKQAENLIGDANGQTQTDSTQTRDAMDRTAATAGVTA